MCGTVSYCIRKGLKIFKDTVIITVTQKDSLYMTIIEINLKAAFFAGRLGSEIREDGGKKQGRKEDRKKDKMSPRTSKL